MRIPRFYTEAGRDPFDAAAFRVTAEGFAVPAHWTGAAADLLAQRVFAARPLPAATRPLAEDGVPPWLHRQEAAGPLSDAVFETDIRAVLHRLAGFWTYRGWKNGLFDAQADARAFYDEIRHLLLHRIAAPEIAAWADCGLDWAYGLAPCFTPAQRTGPVLDGPRPAKRAALLEQDLALAENAPPRASAVCAVENPGVGDFIRWKKDAETEALARRVGLGTLDAALHAVMDACDRDAPAGFDPAENAALRAALRAARAAGIPENVLCMALSHARQGYESLDLPRAAEEEEDLGRVLPVLALSTDFIEAALTGHGFAEGQDAEKLWDGIAAAVWAAGAPQVLFDQGALSQSADGAFLFAPGHAAPAMTLNLPALMRGGGLDTEGAAQAAALSLAALDAMAEDGARPVVLSFADMAGFLMESGLSYDSPAATATAGAVAAFLSGTTHAASAAMAHAASAAMSHAASAAMSHAASAAMSHAASAAMHGPQAAEEKEALRLIKNKMRLLAGAETHLRGSGASACPDAALRAAAAAAWENAYAAAKTGGLRHAHLTGLAAEWETQVLLDARRTGLDPEPATLHFGAGALTAGTETGAGAQIAMRAAVEPFLSGAAGGVIALPAEATADEVRKLFLLAWESGLKRCALCRRPYPAAALAEAERPAAQKTLRILSS